MYEYGSLITIIIATTIIKMQYARLKAEVTMPVIAIPLPCSPFLSETIPRIKPMIDAGSAISQKQQPVIERQQEIIETSPSTREAIAKPFLPLFSLYSGYCEL